MVKRLIFWSRETTGTIKRIGLSNKGSTIAVFSTDLLLAIWCIVMITYSAFAYVPIPIYNIALFISVILLVVICLFSLISIE